MRRRLIGPILIDWTLTPPWQPYSRLPLQELQQSRSGVVDAYHFAHDVDPGLWPRLLPIAISTGWGDPVQRSLKADGWGRAGELQIRNWPPRRVGKWLELRIRRSSRPVASPAESNVLVAPGEQRARSDVRLAIHDQGGKSTTALQARQRSQQRWMIGQGRSWCWARSLRTGATPEEAVTARGLGPNGR